MIKHLVNIIQHLNKNTGKLPVIYIAGKVTGLPYGEVFAKFKLKQAELEANGFYVINPCDFMPEEELWVYAMRLSVILLAVCDNICLLPDWHQSDGATIERNLALRLEISTIED